MPYATWNPADKYTDLALSGGDLIAAMAGVNWRSVRATASNTAGKWYYEITLTDITSQMFGLATAAANTSTYPGQDINGLGCQPNAGFYIAGGSIFTSNGKTHPTGLVAGDIVSLAVDFDAGKVWFAAKGVWTSSGDPAAGTNWAHSFAPGTALFPMLGLQSDGTCTVNFGASAFTYEPPAGFGGWFVTYYESIAESLVSTDLVMGPAWNSIDEGLTLTEWLAEKYPMLLEDSASLADRSRGGFVYDKVAESVFLVADLSLLQFLLTLAESLNLADDPNFGIFEELIESLILTDLSRAKDFVVIPDGFFAYDKASPGWHKTVPESLALTDAATKILQLLMSEWLTITDTHANMWHGTEVVPEALNLYDLAILIREFSETIDESLVATDLAKYRLCLTVLEYLGFTDLATAFRHFTQINAESLVLTDGVSKGFEKTIADTFAAVDVTTVITTFLGVIAESLGIADTTSFIKELGLSVAESLVLTETVSIHAHLYNAVYETLHMNVVVEIDGEIWECYVLNTPKFHPSMYSGFNFNSYCVFEGRAYGANDTGIYELTGTTDAGSTIHTGAILHETDFGSPNQKRFRRGYLGITGTAPVMVFEDENGRREAYTIDTEGKVVASSDLKGKSWKLSIADFDELSTTKLIPVILTK